MEEPYIYYNQGGFFMHTIKSMAEQYVQKMYQSNAGVKDKTKKQNEAVKPGNGKEQRTKKEENSLREEAAVYEPGKQTTKKEATYRKPAVAVKKDKNSDLKAKLEATYENLSKEAKEYLEELKNKFGAIDFFVADCESDEEMGRYFAMGKKEYSCVISSSLLEQMATDEAVREKYETIIDGADETIEEMKNQMEAELGEESGQVTGFGIQIDDNGVVKYFAKLKQSNEQYYEKIKEKRDKERKDAEKAERKDAEKAERKDTEKAERKEIRWVWATSTQELMKEIKNAIANETSLASVDAAVTAPVNAVADVSEDTPAFLPEEMPKRNN